MREAKLRRGGGSKADKPRRGRGGRGNKGVANYSLQHNILVHEETSIQPSYTPEELVNC